MFLKKMQKYIPNFLTTFRCVSSLIVPVFIVYGDEFGAIIAPPSPIDMCFILSKEYTEKSE